MKLTSQRAAPGYRADVPSRCVHVDTWTWNINYVAVRINCVSILGEIKVLTLRGRHPWAAQNVVPSSYLENQAILMIPWKYLEYTLKGTLKGPWRHLEGTLKTSWRDLEGTLKIPWRYLKDTLKTPWKNLEKNHEDTLKTPWKHLEDTLTIS